jgi:hypothetical protein
MKNLRKDWPAFIREMFPAKALFLTVNNFQPRIFTARDACPMICLCIADNVRSGTAP